MKERIVPNVERNGRNGRSILLENLGLKSKKLLGRKSEKQSLTSGTKLFNKNQTIIIKLS